MLSFHGLDEVLFSVFVLFGLFVFGLLLLVLGVFGVFFCLSRIGMTSYGWTPRIHEACQYRLHLQ